MFCQEHSDYAHSLLVLFVELSKNLYGCDFLVYNVHGLVHLADDVKRYGSLDSFSAFPFENELKSLKRLVRKAGNPLAQCIRRLNEQRSFFCDRRISVTVSRSEPASVVHNLGPIPVEYRGAVQVMKLNEYGYVQSQHQVKWSPSDCCVTIRCVGPVLAVNVILWRESLYVVYKQFKRLTDLFFYPLPSSNIGIYKVSGLSNSLHVAPISDILSKCVCFRSFDNDQFDHQYNIFPVVHTLNNTQC